MAFLLPWQIDGWQWLSGSCRDGFPSQYSAATMSARALATVGTSFPALVLGSRILKMKKP